MIETARHSQQVPQRDLTQLQLRIGGNILGERVDQSRIERQQSIFNRNADSRRNITFRMGINIAILVGNEMTFRDNGVSIRNRNGFDGQGLAFNEFDEIVEHIDGTHEISFDAALRCITETVTQGGYV